MMQNKVSNEITVHGMLSHKSPIERDLVFDIALRELSKYGLIIEFTFYRNYELNSREADVVFEWKDEAKRCFEDQERLKELYGWYISYHNSGVTRSSWRMGNRSLMESTIPIQNSFFCSPLNSSTYYPWKKITGEEVRTSIYSSMFRDKNIFFFNIQYDFRTLSVPYKSPNKKVYRMTKLQFNGRDIHKIVVHKFSDKIRLLLVVKRQPAVLKPVCRVVDFVKGKFSMKWGLSTDYYEYLGSFGIENTPEYLLNSEVKEKPIKIGFGYCSNFILEFDGSHYHELQEMLKEFEIFEEERKKLFLEKDDLEEGEEFRTRIIYEDFNYEINLHKPPPEKKNKEEEEKENSYYRDLYYPNNGIDEGYNKIFISSTCPFYDDFDLIKPYLALLSENFEVNYLLESCFSNRVLVREAMSGEFYGLLIDSLHGAQQYTFLRWILSRKKTIYDPIPILKRFIKREEKFHERRVLRDVIGLDKFDEEIVLSILISPTKVILNCPKIDCGNRVLRQFPNHRSHFLRVKFACDEEGFYPSKNIPFQRLVKHYLQNGIVICGRKYCFLVPSESQLRSGSCWFYSSVKLEKEKKFMFPENLRNTLGNFENCKTVPKVLARMGLCFSASYGVKEITVGNEMWKEIPDVCRNGYIFTDGCGRIEKSFFKKICEKIPFGRKYSRCSAVQVRFKGYKGMLTVFENEKTRRKRKEKEEEEEEIEGEEEEKKKKNNEKKKDDVDDVDENDEPVVFVRPSQRKFVVDKNPFDICYGSFSGYRPYHLNREIIMGLEARETVIYIKKILKDIYENQKPRKYEEEEKEEIIKIIEEEEEGEEGEYNNNEQYYDYNNEDYFYLTPECYDELQLDLDLGKVDPFLKELFEYHKKFDELLKLKKSGRLWNKLLEYQDEMIQKLDDMLIDEKTALWTLSNYYFCRQVSTYWIYKGIENGMFNDIYVKKCLYSLSRSSKRMIQNKFNVYITEGIKSFGVCDEYDILEENEVFLRFVRKSRAFGIMESKVCEGPVYITKNPSVSPGDARCLTAINILTKKGVSEEIKNWYSGLENILVFSTKGKRPNAHEMSGSDFDGDEYSVLFDQSLIPKETENFEPNPYDRIQSPNFEPIQLSGEDRLDKMIDFFLTYQRDYNLGEISNVHATHYAESRFGILSEKCRSLSLLHSVSVDSAKSGNRVEIPYHLKTDYRPFFVKSVVPEHRRIRSTNLVGKMFRKMESVLEKIERFKYPKKNICDPDIIDVEIFKTFPGFKELYRRTKSVKILFDEEISVICMQYGIRNESDLFTQGYVYYKDKFSVSVRSLEISVRRLHTKFRGYFKKISEIPGINNNNNKRFIRGRRGRGRGRGRKVDSNNKRKWREKKELNFDELELDEYLELFNAQLWYYVSYCGGTPRKVSFAWINGWPLMKLKIMKVGSRQKELFEKVKNYVSLEPLDEDEYLT